MKKILSVICAAALLAASTGIAAAQQYPACKSKSDDMCMQGAKLSAPAKMPMYKAAHKAVHKSVMKTGARPMKRMVRAGAASGFNIPHGCSPATTPCE